MVHMSAANSSCVILVPALAQPTPKCEEGLRELERRGYPIRRVRGFSAIDQGRNQMASDALHDGFAETMWIDTDIGFTADSVDRLRFLDLPIAAGLYPQPGARSLACKLLPETDELVFGEKGGLVEVLYVAAGFLHVRRATYVAIRDKLALPLCNTRFGRGVWPFFQPLAAEEEMVTIVASANDSTARQVRHRYLTDDYAFCHRARQAGFNIMADTTIRLWRTGSYGFGWEDAGSDPERFDTYHFHAE
jgi:hypothetical protein